MHVSFAASSTRSYVIRAVLAAIISAALVGSFSLGYSWLPYAAAELVAIGALAVTGYYTGMVIASWVARHHTPPRRLPRYRFVLTATSLFIVTTTVALPLYLNPPSSGYEGDLGAGLTFIILELAYAYLAPLTTAGVSVLLLLALRRVDE